jgi:uncharacterized protein YyaL (SSP411 family)
MTNRLAAETSPYLRQHADNPVDWWAWGEPALAAARAQDKPILLSIGYSACHWCHVMAHESFENAATAAVMNDLYINIKVDREERPDLDKIYQLAHQALTRRGGGWPLTVFLAADDHLPFYAGTYFPREPRYGMPPFVHVLQQVRAFWDQRRGEVRSQNAALAEFLADYGSNASVADALTDAPIRAALAQSEQSFDPVHGGHAGAPKFPHCPEMELLLDLGKNQQQVQLTLTRIAAGGIHDQIGGGFCRYSVDERWEIPHFEKMLYDNAQLLPLFAREARANNDKNDARLTENSNAARGIVAWLQREMTAPDGGFYSALDADSEHEEGRFYVWQRDEVRTLLTPEELAVVEPHYGFDRAANFEQVAWNPIIALPLGDVAQSLDITSEEASTRLSRARARLFSARSVRPGLDDKILTSWNALMIGGLARASCSKNASALMGLADNALDHLYTAAWRDGRLYATDTRKLPAYLDDYAFLLGALLECLQCRWSDRDIAWAIQLADALLECFEDRAHGGFFFTAHDHETLIQRPKPWADEAVPSGNGVAARALLRLGHLLGETRYLDAAERTLRAAYSTMQQMPLACASLQRALNDFLHPRAHVVIRVAGDAEAGAWTKAFGAINPDAADVYLIPSDASAPPGILAAQSHRAGGIAYLCRGANCLPPISDPADLAAAFADPND